MTIMCHPFFCISRCLWPQDFSVFCLTRKKKQSVRAHSACGCARVLLMCCSRMSVGCRDYNFKQRRSTPEKNYSINNTSITPTTPTTIRSNSVGWSRASKVLIHRTERVALHIPLHCRYFHVYIRSRSQQENKKSYHGKRKRHTHVHRGVRREQVRIIWSNPTQTSSPSPHATRPKRHRKYKYYSKTAPKYSNDKPNRLGKSRHSSSILEHRKL